MHQFGAFVFSNKTSVLTAARKLFIYLSLLFLGAFIDLASGNSKKPIAAN